MGAQGMGEHGTWKCACEKVVLKLNREIFAPYQDCFCDDCNIRVRVCQDKYCGPEEKRAQWNKFAHNGAYELMNVADAAHQVESGEDQIAYLKCAVKNKGTEWQREHSNDTLTLYAKCCGSLIGHHGPAPSFELNTDGLQ